jgi:hypothetical protein
MGFTAPVRRLDSLSRCTYTFPARAFAAAGEYRLVVRAGEPGIGARAYPFPFVVKRR